MELLLTKYYICKLRDLIYKLIAVPKSFFEKSPSRQPESRMSK